MGQRHVVALLLLLAVAGSDDDVSPIDESAPGPEDRLPEHDDDGLVTRIARRATGRMAEVVEPDAFLDKVDVNAVLDRVDPDALLDRVDVDRLLDRVDVNRLLDRVDANALLDRVDVDALMDRVDVQTLVDRAGISDIVKESTGALAGGFLDVFRRQVVALDSITSRAAYSLIGRDPNTRPDAPAGLEAAQGVDETGRGQVTGHFAGPVSRLLAFLADVGVIWLGYLAIAFGIAFVVELFSSLEVDTVTWGIVALSVFVLWSFTYMWISYSIAGKTIGMGVVGLRVLNRQGKILTGGQAALRTLVLPVSVFFFGLGCLGILFSPERRALHDVTGGSVVVYDWGDRPAEMPAPITAWAQRHGDETVIEDLER